MYQNVKYNQVESLIKTFLMPLGTAILDQQQFKLTEKIYKFVDFYTLNSNLVKQNHITHQQTNLDPIEELSQKSNHEIETEFYNLVKIYEDFSIHIQLILNLQDEIQCLDIKYITFQQIGKKIVNRQYKCFKDMDKDIKWLLNVKVNIISSEIQQKLVNIYNEICSKLNSDKENQHKGNNRCEKQNSQLTRKQRLIRRQKIKQQPIQKITNYHKQFLINRFNRLNNEDKQEVRSHLNKSLLQNNQLQIDKLTINEFRNIQKIIDHINNRRLYNQYVNLDKNHVNHSDESSLFIEDSQGLS